MSGNEVTRHRGTTAPSRAPHRDVWLLVALVPCIAMAVVGAGRSEGPWLAWVGDGLLAVLPLFAVALSVAAAVSIGFARLSGRAVIPGAAASACLFVLTLPSGAPLVESGVALAFGLIVGREIFGSQDRTFVHGAVLAHVFLASSWPDSLGQSAHYMPTPDVADWVSQVWMAPPGSALGATSALACVIGVPAVVALGVVHWRVIVAVPIGASVGLVVLAAAGHAAASPETIFTHLVAGNLLFGTAFLAGQPGSSPTTTSGMWFHGALIGFLVILFRLTIPASPDATLSAILVASIFAPLADHVVRASAARAKRTAHG